MGAIIESFHYHAKILISDTTLLVGFLMLWLKKYIVSTRKAIIVDVVCPTVLLAHGHSLALL